jgi:hypothetical protein
MCIFHKWTQWELYKYYYKFTPGILAPKELRGKFFDDYDLRQRRHCLKCGKTQDVNVKK